MVLSFIYANCQVKSNNTEANDNVRKSWFCHWLESGGHCLLSILRVHSGRLIDPLMPVVDGIEEKGKSLARGN